MAKVTGWYRHVVRYAGVMSIPMVGGMTAAADARRGRSARSGKRDTDIVVVLSRLDHGASVGGEGSRTGWSAWGVAAALAGGIGGTLWNTVATHWALGSHLACG